MQNESVVSQEHPMGCAVACVASICKMPYTKALQLFSTPENAWTRGFYCDEVVSALSRQGFERTFSKFDPELHSEKLNHTGTIVFVDPNARYPSGHYLVRTEGGWMNPWSNFPQMIPVLADLAKSLPGEVSYIIY